MNTREAKQAQEKLLAFGIDLELSAATVLSAYQKLFNQGFLASEDDVLLIGTARRDKS